MIKLNCIIKFFPGKFWALKPSKMGEHECKNKRHTFSWCIAPWKTADDPPSSSLESLLPFHPPLSLCLAFIELQRSSLTLCCVLNGTNGSQCVAADNYQYTICFSLHYGMGRETNSHGEALLWMARLTTSRSGLCNFCSSIKYLNNVAHLCTLIPLSLFLIRARVGVI